MKLTYWVVKNNDANVYHERFKLRRDAFEHWRSKRVVTGSIFADDYIHKPEKVVVEYKDSFDLVCTMLSEGGVE